jgi:pimeloyl-ACP methyl ester carboxylesterase
MKKLGFVLLVLALLLGAVAAMVLGPYVLRVEHHPAEPERGYHADFYLYVSPGARHRAEQGELAVLLVQPNNSGTNSDDAEVHRKDAWWTAFGRHSLADELEVVLLVPAFLRPAEDWRIYTHALDRDVFTTEREDLGRLDLQLIAMIEHARGVLADGGLETRERVLIQGFSASAMFADRFTALHPERVLGLAAGSPGGWPIAPLEEVDGEMLRYPVGVGDLESLRGRPFARATFALVPQLHVLGALDDNDSLPFRDGYEEQDELLVDRLFGPDPQARFDAARRLHEQVGAQARFLLVEGVGHDRRALQSHTTEFFAQLLGR